MEDYFNYQITINNAANQIETFSKNLHIDPSNGSPKPKDQLSSVSEIVYDNKDQLRKIKKLKNSKRKELINQIKEILENLEDDIVQKPQQILTNLKNIQKIADQYKLDDIKDITAFSLLKEKLENLDKALATSTYHKWQIQSPFRETKIQEFDYLTLQQQKLKQNSFLVYPYKWGKGFKPFLWGKSCNHDDQMDMRYLAPEKMLYNYALEYANYQDTVHKINDIIFQTEEQSNQGFFRTIQYWIFLVTAGCLIITINYWGQNPTIFLILFYSCLSVFGFIFVFQLYYNQKNLFLKPENKTELEMNVINIQKLFNTLNQQILTNSKFQTKFQWICPDNFLYLELKFINGLPKKGY